MIFVGCIWDNIFLERSIEDFWTVNLFNVHILIFCLSIFMQFGGFFHREGTGECQVYLNLGSPIMFDIWIREGYK